MKVLCINAKNLPKMLPQSITSKLVEGNIYTVEKELFFDMQCEKGYILKEIPFPKNCMFQGFLAKRFKPVETQETQKEVEYNYLLN